MGWGGGPILKTNLIHLRANAHFHIFIPKTRQFADNLLFICNQPPEKKPWIGFACVSCYEIGTRKKINKIYIFMTLCILSGTRWTNSHQHTSLYGWWWMDKELFPVPYLTMVVVSPQWLFCSLANTKQELLVKCDTGLDTVAWQCVARQIFSNFFWLYPNYVWLTNFFSQFLKNK